MTLPPRSDQPGHEVTNQPFTGWAGDLWAEDLALQEAAQAFGADAAALSAFGQKMGSPDMRNAGRDANRHLPELVAFDAQGRRLDEVHYHPAYHQLLQHGLGAGYAALPWEGAPGGHATHAAIPQQQTLPECCLRGDGGHGRHGRR